MASAENGFIPEDAENRTRLGQNQPVIVEEFASNGGFVPQKNLDCEGAIDQTGANSSVNREILNSNCEASLGNVVPKPSGDEQLSTKTAGRNTNSGEELLTIAVGARVLVQRPGGRPHALNGELRNAICAQLKLGLSRSMAAVEVGIDRKTVSRTMQRDPEFRRQVLEAEELFERSPLLTVIAEAKHNWRAAIWLLKNYQPHDSVQRRKQKQNARGAKRQLRETTRAMEEDASFSQEYADKLREKRARRKREREEAEDKKRLAEARLKRAEQKAAKAKKEAEVRRQQKEGNTNQH